MIRLFVLFLILFTGHAFAETIPASQTGYKFGTITNSDPETACRQYVALTSAHTYWKIVPSGSNYLCYWSYNGGYNSSFLQSAPGYICPSGQNWTLSGSNCTRPDCPAGEFRRLADGLCVKDCSGKTGQALPSSRYEFANDGGEPMVGGCVVRCSTWYSGSKTNSLIPNTQSGGGCTYTGVPPLASGTPGVGFEPKPKAPESPKDCQAQGLGFVQSSTGAVTCTASGDAPPENRPKVKETTTTTTGNGTPGSNGEADPNAPGATTTEKTSETTGGKTTTTTKETSAPGTDTNGNPTCTAPAVLVDGKCEKTTTTTESTDDFCTKNPNATTCKADKKAADDPCIENPNRLGCMDHGDVPTEPGLTTKEGSISSITPVAVATNAQCPQGPPLPRGMGNFSFDGICQMASGIRPVVLAMAWLSAGLILLGAFRES